MEVLPIRVLTDEDVSIYGNSCVALAKLYRASLPVVSGLAVSPPNLKLKTILEHFQFENREIFEESLTLVKKEIGKIPIPDVLIREAGKHKDFLIYGQRFKSVRDLWQALLSLWLGQIKARLWNSGFYPGITEGLEAKVVVFIKKLKAFGKARFNPFSDEVQIQVQGGKLEENDFKEIANLVKLANKKLFIPHEYEWVLDSGIKLSGVLPYAAFPQEEAIIPKAEAKKEIQKSAVKVFFDLSKGFSIEKNVDGIYIAAEKIYDLNKPQVSFDEMVFKVVESAITFPFSPILFKLADISEGMGKIRGSLRLLHQKSLLEPMLSALDFARHKKGLGNVHVVIPFMRSVNELLQIKRELAVKKLMRKSSLEMWLEICVPENIINIENYLMTGIDGVVLNLDELIAHINGFDPNDGELAVYKNEVDSLIKFLEDAVKIIHKSKIPFLAYGSLTFYPKVLEFLVGKGVYGIVAERFDVHSAYDLLHQTERRIILRRI